jgi:hypothetical protein
MNKIPSDDEFARASKHMEERSRNLDDVRKKVIRYFKKICPLHNFYILDQNDVDFRAYVFFKKDADIKACEKVGINNHLIDFVYAELELLGKGNKKDINVAFEFDSDENVTAKYKGDYFMRLR